MSASRSRSRSSSGRSNKKKPSTSTTSAPTPSNRNAIDYAPARAAISDLAKWAFDLAERNVEDWPVARQRVKNVRRSIMAELGSTRAPRASLEDLMFTASLIARILDADLGLDLGEALAVLEYLDLPAEDLPLARPPMRVHKPTGRRTPPPLRFCDDCGYVHEPGDHIGYRNAA